MAKKIKLLSSPDKAKIALSANKIEHVFIDYRKDNDKGDVFVVVKNKDFEDATYVLNSAEIDFRKKSTRHYELMALRYEHYQPMFTCQCRHCGKSFTHPVKEARWCSKECRKAFRNAKKSTGKEAA